MKVTVMKMVVFVRDGEQRGERTEREQIRDIIKTEMPVKKGVEAKNTYIPSEKCPLRHSHRPSDRRPV